MLREAGRPQSVSLDRPQRGVGIGRCYSYPKLRTARRPSAFAVTAGGPAGVLMAPLGDHLDLFSGMGGLAGVTDRRGGHEHLLRSAATVCHATMRECGPAFPLTDTAILVPNGLP